MAEKSRWFFAYTPPEFRFFSSVQQAVFGLELQYAQDALVDARLAYLPGANRVLDAGEGRGVILRHEDYIRPGLDREHGAFGGAVILGYRAHGERVGDYHAVIAKLPAQFLCKQLV